MSFINAEDLLKATNGGLEIILSLYPDATESVDKPNRKFKMRNEKTASAKLNRTQDGIYLVHDFGGDGKSKGAIQCYCSEENCSYGDAIKELASRFNVSSVDGEAITVNKANFSSRAAISTETDGTWSFETTDTFEPIHIETLLSLNIRKTLGYDSPDEEKRNAAIKKIESQLKYYHIHPLKNYTIIKNRQAMTFTATERYPMFLIDEGDNDTDRFQKIYQPLHDDKGMRFLYVPGKKPSRFIHGLQQLNIAHEELKDSIDEKKDQGEEEGDKKKYTDDDYKLPEVILCTGASDAINVALCGYRVIWLNSETEPLAQYSYDKIASKVKKFYLLGDIDATGKKERHKMCMQYLEIYDIELPSALLTKRDRRGNPCKDVRDYFNFYSRKDFKALVEYSAMPYRFWEKRMTFNKNGTFRGFEYKFKNEYAYNFLEKNGFFRTPYGNKQTEFQFIHIDGNIVRITEPIKIKNFIIKFLRERNFDVELRDEMHRTAQLNESSLNALNEIIVEFCSGEKNRQFLFYANKTLEVSADQIIEHKLGAVDRFVWEDEIHPHRIKLADQSPFLITKNEMGDYNIKIQNDSCLFLKYLVQSSRTHWRVELEERLNKANLTALEKEKYRQDHLFSIDGPLLTPEETGEQQLHLINKLFLLGYFMHSYKNRAKSWFAFGMDGKLNEEGKSHGGSGKSLFFDNALKSLTRKFFVLDGRNSKINEDSHKWGGLTGHEKYAYVDDGHEWLNLEMFYSVVTGDWAVNPKGKTGFVIPHDLSPKLAITSNYTPKNLSPSTERRIIYGVWSDYYHILGETTDYLENRSPATEFGKEMFKEFTESEWNDFYNTAIYALKFYLGTTDKISPAMSNVNTRNLVAQMGPLFYDWAKTYFSDQGDKLDVFFPRNEPYEDFVHKFQPQRFTAQSFKTKLAAFCKLEGYILNPKHYQGKKGPIIQKWPKRIYDKRQNSWTVVDGEKVPTELFYIQTKADDNQDDHSQTPEQLVSKRLKEIENDVMRKKFQGDSTLIVGDETGSVFPI